MDLEKIPILDFKVSCHFKCLTGVFLAASCCLGQTDPGPRTDAAGAGGYYRTLNTNEQALFNAGLADFKEVDSVSGKLEPGFGLGPTFNGNSCAMCHAQPAVGGSSPGLTSPQLPMANPQVALATLDGAKNTVPSFITANGPVREARFIATSTQFGAPLDGGVHALYTITGRSDAPGCNVAQPNFAQQVSSNNIIYRIPTPVFGLGLVEATTDATLQANLTSTQSKRSPLGIFGRFNTNGNDGTITRFGWKAQNKSLLTFSGEAYNVEMGVSNDAFPNERGMVSGCGFNGTPEDTIHAAGTLSDVVEFAIFMRLSAAPTPNTTTSSQINGQALFTSTGCVLCHSAALTTGPSQFTGMSNVTYAPYSDFALHHMGSNLADGVNQGAATPDEFRTAPLWGLGQRLFFLHDGRTSDLLQTIAAHASSTSVCAISATSQIFTANSLSFLPVTYMQFCGSEADGVINKFNALSSSQKQDLLNFLRSL